MGQNTVKGKPSTPVLDFSQRRIGGYCSRESTVRCLSLEMKADTRGSVGLVSGLLFCITSVVLHHTYSYIHIATYATTDNNMSPTPSLKDEV